MSTIGTWPWSFGRSEPCAWLSMMAPSSYVNPRQLHRERKKSCVAWCFWPYHAGGAHLCGRFRGSWGKVSRSFERSAALWSRTVPYTPVNMLDQSWTLVLNVQSYQGFRPQHQYSRNIQIKHWSSILSKQCFWCLKKKKSPVFEWAKNSPTIG